MRVIEQHPERHAGSSRVVKFSSSRTSHLSQARSVSGDRTLQLRSKPPVLVDLMPSGTPTRLVTRFRLHVIEPIIRGLRRWSSRLEKM